MLGLLEGLAFAEPVFAGPVAVLPGPVPVLAVVVGPFDDVAIGAGGATWLPGVEVLGPVFTDADELVVGPELLGDDGGAVLGPFSAFEVTVELAPVDCPVDLFGDPAEAAEDGLPVDGLPETELPLEEAPEAGAPVAGAPVAGAPVEGLAAGIVVAKPGRAPG